MTLRPILLPLLASTLFLGCDSGEERPAPILSDLYTGHVVDPNPSGSPFGARFEFLPSDGAEEEVTVRITFVRASGEMSNTHYGLYVHPDLLITISSSRYRGTVSDDGTEIRGHIHYSDLTSVELNLEKE